MESYLSLDDCIFKSFIIHDGNCVVSLNSNNEILSSKEANANFVTSDLTVRELFFFSETNRLPTYIRKPKINT